MFVNQQWDALYVKDNKVELLSKIFRNYPTGRINSVGISNNRLYIDDENFTYKVIGDSCVKFRDSPGKTISVKKMIVGMDEKDNIILAKYPRYLDYSQSVRANDTTTAHQIKDEIFFFDTRNGNFYRKINLKYKIFI